MDAQNFKGTNTYKGDLRIVGQVVNNISDKEPIGYVVMVEKTQQIKTYTTNQIKILLSKFKFVNAELKDGKIINTECAMDRLPKFNTGLHVIDNFGILILGEIRSNSNKKLGYRAMDTHGKIVDIKEDELLKLADTGISIINAKIVSRGDKKNISAIKSEFTKIIKSNDKNDKSIKTNPRLEWRKKKHNQKLVNFLYKWVIKQSFCSGNINIGDGFYSRGEDSGRDTRYIDLDREAKIAFTEIFTPEHDITLTAKDKELVRKIMNMPHIHMVTAYTRIDDATKLYILSIAQFLLNDDKVFSEIKSYIVSKRVNNFKYADELLSNDIASERYKKLYNEIMKAILAKKVQRKTDEIHNQQKMFNTQTFTTEKNIQQLGFTLNKESDNMEIKTDTGFNKTLAYVGKYIKYDYDKLSNKSRCLGDLLCVAYIEKLINRYGNIDDPSGWAENYNMKKSDIRATIEMIIALAFMFNSQVMKEYTDSISDKLQRLGINIDYDEIANVDYQIPDEITLYYASGFNVFLSDASEYNYKKEYLKNAKLINYRQLGIKHNIKHKLLQEDLALMVSLVTSEDCSIETISELIGKLRFL